MNDEENSTITVNDKLRASVKQALRISNGNTTFDEEIDDLIFGCVNNLYISGIKKIDVAEDLSDRLLVLAIKTYCKANFGMSNPDSEKYMQSFESQRQHLTLTMKYKNLAPMEIGDS